VSQQAERAQQERAQWVALAQPPAQLQHHDGDGAVTAAVAQQAGSDPASHQIT